MVRSRLIDASMNPVLNHFNLQEIKAQVATMKDMVEKISFPSETIQKTNNEVLDLKAKIDVVDNKIQDVKGHIELIDSDISMAVHQLADIEQHLDAIEIALGFIVKILLMNVTIGIFSLGALAWVIVKLYH